MSDDRFMLNRRRALQLIASTAVIPVVNSAPMSETNVDVAPIANLKDPNLQKPHYPWALVLEKAELASLAVLCDCIIPAENGSPSASEVGAHHYINEHVSAPYEQHRADLVDIRGGITWLNGESARRFGQQFSFINKSQRDAICKDIHWLHSAAPEYKNAARFFGKIRNMTASGYFTTKRGMDDIGYVGNVGIAYFF